MTDIDTHPFNDIRLVNSIYKLPSNFRNDIIYHSQMISQKKVILNYGFISFFPFFFGFTSFNFYFLSFKKYWHVLKAVRAFRCLTFKRT